MIYLRFLNDFGWKLGLFWYFKIKDDRSSLFHLILNLDIYNLEKLIIFMFIYYK